MAELVLLCLLSLAGFICSDAVAQDMIRGEWWKDYLSSPKGNAWFEPWNNLIQARVDELVGIVEAREEDATEPFRVMMVGDSTMEHQFGVVCAFLGERDGRRFDPEETQERTPGCCTDTAEGGGRGLCFDYTWFRFLDPKGAAKQKVDAYYFGSGLHLLHMAPAGPLEPIRVQEWLHYEDLVAGTVEALRGTNPDVRIVFMTNHVVSDQLYAGEYATIRDAYRVGEGNSTIRAECYKQVEAAAGGDVSDHYYYDWRGTQDIAEYCERVPGGEFTASTYCEEALMDRHGSQQLIRRARPVLTKLGVPMVDAAHIVERQAWASNHADGRHYRPIVPLEVFALLGALVSPPLPPLLPAGEAAGPGEDCETGPHLISNIGGGP